MRTMRTMHPATYYDPPRPWLWDHAMGPRNVTLIVDNLFRVSNFQEDLEKPMSSYNNYTDSVQRSGYWCIVLSTRCLFLGKSLITLFLP